MPILDWSNRKKDLQIIKNIPFRIINKKQVYGNPEFNNMLIQGDNLDALKSLLPYYAGRVKCIFIDPQNDFYGNLKKYIDDIEVDNYLSFIYPKLELLKKFLRSDAFFIVHTNDSDGYYIKVLCDEIFGRDNYDASFYIQLNNKIEQAHIYKASLNSKPNLHNIEYNYSKFKYYIKEKNSGRDIILGGKKVTIFLKDEFEIKEDIPSVNGLKEIWASGTILDGNSSGRFFRDYIKGRSKIDGLEVLYKIYDIGDDGLGYRYMTGPKRNNATQGKYYQGIPVSKKDHSKTKTFKPIKNFYDFSNFFDNNEKPEEYLKMILEHFSNPGDIVLDSFLGSGTTAAVAHKMGRKYIGIEIDDYVVTHCIPRLQKVIEGEQGGISEAVGWKGGGGFIFYTLGEPVFAEDGSIRPDITFAQLAAHVWFTETGVPLNGNTKTPLLGVHKDTAIYLLFNGILGDTSTEGGNVLTKNLLQQLPQHNGKKIVYGEKCLLDKDTLINCNIIFKQTPYDIKV